VPEGDSIVKAAARLRPRLVGHRVRWLKLRERGDVFAVVGATVERISTHGKHMMMHIGSDWVLRVHLGMKGRWRWGRTLDPEEYRFSAASVVLGTASSVAICSGAMTAALRRADDPQLRRTLRNLGPDLLSESCDLTQIVRRARAEQYRERPVAELLLDQRVAAGVGNVYKSEVLFLVGVHPMSRVAHISDETLEDLFATCRRLMKINLLPGLRTTTAGPSAGIRRPPSLSRHWVYRRRGLRCFRCRTPIERGLIGDQARSTYWCPRCQPRA
jgi:endonuclease VIII